MIRYFARHGNAANLLMIAVFLIGLYGVSSMIRQTFPDFNYDLVIIETKYPGATAEEVETSICTTIEDAVESLSGINKVTATAREGLAVVSVEMRDGHSIDRLSLDIKNEIDKIDTLPDEAEEPLVYIKRRQEEVVSIAITGDLPVRDLKEYGEFVREQLLQDDLISSVKVRGFSDFRLSIEIEEKVLRGLSLTIPQIVEIIRTQSQDVPVGDIRSKEQKIVIRVVDQKRSIRAFGNIVVVSPKNGALVRLADIASINWELEQEEQASFIRDEDGKSQRAALLTVYKEEGEDALTIRKAVYRFVEKYQKKLPSGIKMKCMYDVARVIQDRLMLLVRNGLQGFVLVFLTLWFFLDIRCAFWVAMGIPFSFLGGLWLMELTGHTLNMITMFGLLLALGLIVDDAVVIAENIYSHWKRGKEPLAACVDGTKEVGAGIISSLLTTLATGLPVLLMVGEMGKILAVMPIGVIFGLSMSVVEAFFVLPNHLSHSLEKAPTIPNKIRARIEDTIQYIIQIWVARGVAACIRNRYLTCVTVVALFILSLGFLAGGRVGFMPLPKLDGDVLVCHVLLPQGTPLSRTKTVVQKIEMAADAVNKEWTPLQPKEQKLVRNINVIYGINSDADEIGSHAVTVFIELLTSEMRIHNCNEIIQKWRENTGLLPDVVSLKFGQMLPTPGGKPIEVQLKGDDLSVLHAASIELQAKLASFEGVYNITDDLIPGKWEARVTTLPLARTLGLSSAEISRQLSSSFFGTEAQQYQHNGNSVEVQVKIAGGNRNSLQDLESFFVTTREGSQVPLLNVARVQIARGYSQIHRSDGHRTVTIDADVDKEQASSTKIINDLAQGFLKEIPRRYPGVSVHLAGQAYETQKTMNSLGIGALYGIIAVFIILAFNFSSYIEPLIVMIAIPFGLIGSIFGHLFLGIPLSMPSMAGFVSLCGVVVNDSILLIEFMKNNVKEGHLPIKAVHLASVSRFRAIFLTTATTVAGLLPLLVEKSLQAQILLPMAVSIVFGLTAATTLILVFIPSLIGILCDWRILKFTTVEKEEA